MWDGVPSGRATAPVPRKPPSHPHLFMTSTPSATRRRENSLIEQRARGGGGPSAHNLGSPAKAMVFERTHPPVVETITLPEETLRALRQTRSLFLCCRNLLSFSQIRHLEHMTQLVSLNVHMNAISRIECLGHLQHLTELDVSANELCAVDEDAFKGLRHLKRLNLSSNFLTVVNGFQHLPALEWLSLSFNELDDIQGIRRLPCPQQLFHLDVCGNKLATLAELEKSLENCRDLQDLRVETPKTTLVLPTAPPGLHLRENPFCLTEPNYTERLLQRFERLVVLNGVTCGYDPTVERRVREHGTTTATTITRDFDDGLLLSSADVASSGFVRPYMTPPRQFTNFFTSSAAAAMKQSSMVENVTCGSSSPTGPSNSTSSISNSSAIDNHNYSIDKTVISDSNNPSSLSRRAKRVSRSVLTQLSIPLHKEMHISSVEESIQQGDLKAKEEAIERLETKLNRSQEQLALRVALEEDLRRNFEDLRVSHVALVDSSASEKKRLGRQVKALKDELSRRSEEAVILQRKNRVELEERTKALREDLLKQKKESTEAMKLLEEELARVRKESNDEVKELRARLGNAASQNEWLEEQNDKMQTHLKKWQHESESNKAAAMTCEVKLNLLNNLYSLQQEEIFSRRQVEFDAWSNIITASATQLHLLQCENESLVLCGQDHQKAWEEYTNSLQQHYRAVLLQSQTVEVIPPTGVDAGCDPIDGLAHQEQKEEEETHQLRAALSLTRQSEQLLSVENERLLRCIEDKEREVADATQQLQNSEEAARRVKDAFERERENLFRTLHNLRETIAKKDAAFEEMEAEAKMKIDEKRSVIAKLQERLEDAEYDVANHQREATKLRGVQEELKRVSTELHALQQERAKSEATVVEAPHHQLEELMEALESTKEKLTSSVVREHQQSQKLSRAAEALTLLRGQLARVDEDNSRLRREIDDKTSLLRVAEAEKDRLQTQWREAQEVARVRQRATLQAISQIMVDGDVGG